MFSTCTYRTINCSGNDFKVGSDLDEVILNKFNKCIESYKCIFVNQWSDVITTTTAGSCFIKTLKNSRPVVCPSNKLTRRQNEMLAEKMSELLRIGVVQHSSNSEWSSNAYVKEIEGGKLSLYVNYSKLNETLEDIENCTIRSLDDLFRSYSRSNVFSKLVIKDAFYQIPMNNKDIKKTAFRTELGNFEFNSMPYNLKNANKIFYKIIRKAITDQKSIRIHSDQILVSTRDSNSHLVVLKQLFKDRRDANFKVDVEKSCFGVERVEFGGHEISSHGFSIGLDQLDKIRSFASPRSQLEMCSFLDLIQPYRRYILTNYQTLIKPLMELSVKKEAFSWNLKSRTAFYRLITSLMNASHLDHFSECDVQLVDKLLLDENGNCLKQLYTIDSDS